MTKFQLGDKIPSFTLPTVTGETFSFSEHQDQHQSWHLIVFFRGPWCPVCKSELNDLQESKGFFEGENVHLITISSEKLDNLKSFSEEENLSFTMLSDESLEAINSFDVYYHGEDAPYEDHGAHGEPAYFLVDEKGKLLYQQRQTGPFGRPSTTELRKIVKYIKKNLKSD